MSRDFIQRLVGVKANLAFGPASMTTQERTKRTGEEAIELMQAGGVSLEDALKLVIYVYGRPVGEVQQEIGGVMVTLLALCHSAGYSLDWCEQQEVERFLMKDISYWTERVKLKAAAGVAAYGDIVLSPKEAGTPEGAVLRPSFTISTDAVGEIIHHIKAEDGVAYLKDPQSEW